MLKNFYYFTRGQRIGTLILLTLIVVAFFATVLMPKFIEHREIDDGSEFLKEAQDFRAGLIEKERNQRTETDFYPFQYRNYPRTKPFEEKYELFAFNPNTADSVTFVKLGLKPYVARNILNYRAKGGKFKTVASFSKVYGITPEKFQELEPFIQIPDIIADNAAVPFVSQDAQAEPSELKTPPQIKESRIIEINGADTALLKEVKGIGTVFSKRIVSYRKILGGYYSVEQLKEVYGMTSESFEKISPSITIDPTLISKIDVNKASIERLKSHPYIKTFQRAKAIYEYRRKKVKLQDISQLKHLEEFTDEDWQKLEPYLAFE